MSIIRLASVSGPGAGDQDVTHLDVGPAEGQQEQDGDDGRQGDLQEQRAAAVQPAGLGRRL